MLQDYYTISEYAKITQKDPGNIRRHLISGNIMGEKVGKQWLIPKDTIYPVDKRLKTGVYSDQRRKVILRKTHPDLMKALTSMSKDMRKIYGDNLSEIVLYGSYARGTETPESDVDIVLFLNVTASDKEHDSMTDTVVDYELEQGKTLSVITVEIDHYKKNKDYLPFYRNIQKEGVVLWKKT